MVKEKKKSEFKTIIDLERDGLCLAILMQDMLLQD